MGITLGDVRGAHGCHGCVCHRLFFVLHGIAPMASLLTTPRPTLLALAVTALLIAPLAHAEEGSADPSARTLDTVQVTADGDIADSYTVKRASTATKLGLSLRHTPQTHSAPPSTVSLDLPGSTCSEDEWGCHTCLTKCECLSFTDRLYA